MVLTITVQRSPKSKFSLRIQARKVSQTHCQTLKQPTRMGEAKILDADDDSRTESSILTANSSDYETEKLTLRYLEKIPKLEEPVVEKKYDEENDQFLVRVTFKIENSVNPRFAAIARSKVEFGSGSRLCRIMFANGRGLCLAWSSFIFPETHDLGPAGVRFKPLFYSDKYFYNSNSECYKVEFGWREAAKNWGYQK